MLWLMNVSDLLMCRKSLDSGILPLTLQENPLKLARVGREGEHKTKHGLSVLRVKKRSRVIGKKKAYGKSISLAYIGIKTDKRFQRKHMWFLPIHYNISAKRNFQHRSKSNDIWTTMSFEVWIKYAPKIMAAYLSPEVSFLPFLSTVWISPSTDSSQFATIYHADLRIF